MNQQVKNGGNLPLYESDMLSFTTDIRMEKLPQLDSSGHAIEAMFWLKDLMAQWRVKGRAFAIGNPDENATDEVSSRAEIGKWLRVKDDVDSTANNWTWENAVTKYFANHSPIMRGMLSRLRTCLVKLATKSMYLLTFYQPRLLQESTPRTAQVRGPHGSQSPSGTESHGSL